MRIKDIVEVLNAEVFTPEIYDENIELNFAFGSDLMSDALMLLRTAPDNFFEEGMLLTGLVTKQSVRTAEMLDFKLIVIVRGKKPNENVYEAAMDLGATQTQALWKVIIPDIIPGILSGFMLSITLSLDDYVITAFTKPTVGGFDTISTYVVNATRGSQTEVKTALWALSTIIFLIVLIIALFGNRGGSRRRDAGSGKAEL